MTRNDADSYWIIFDNDLEVSSWSLKEGEAFNLCPFSIPFHKITIVS